MIRGEGGTLVSAGHADAEMRVGPVKGERGDVMAMLGASGTTPLRRDTRPG